MGSVTVCSPAGEVDPSLDAPVTKGGRTSGGISEALLPKKPALKSFTLMPLCGFELPTSNPRGMDLLGRRAGAIVDKWIRFVPDVSVSQGTLGIL